MGAISGVVVNAAGQPAEGVRVCALDTASCATSDARGAFRIGELRAGAYRLEILPLEGLPFTSDPVDVRAGLDGTVDITLPKAENFQQTVTVTAPAFQAPEEVKNSGFLVEPRADPQERRGPAGRVALRAGPAGRGDRQQRLPQRHHRPRRQPAREPVRGGQRRDSQHQRLRELRVGRRHGEPARCRADTGCDVPHRRLPRALHQPHVERAAGDPARGQSQEVRRVGHARLRRRRRHSRRAHQRGEGIVGGVGATKLPGSVHPGRGLRRRAGGVFVQRQGRVRPHAPGPHLDGQHRGHRRDSAGPQRLHRPRRRDCQLRHPLQRLAQRHGLQLAAHLRVARRGPVGHHPLRGQGGPAGERPGGAGRAAAGCAARGRHRAEPRGLLRGFARGRDHHQVRPHRARAVLRHGAGRRQLQDVPHRLHGGIALRQRHAVLAGARHRPVLSRHALPVVPDRRVLAGLEAGGLARERHAGRTRRPLRRPVAGPVQSARGRQGAPHRRALVELERRVVLSAAGVPLRVGVSPERVARALARRPLRDRPRVVAHGRACE